jgi:protein O-GlcNAc transferase
MRFDGGNMSKSKGRRIFHQAPQTPPHSLEIAATFQKALTLHQQGQLVQAESLYRIILKQAPKHFDARHLLGFIQYQRNNFDATARLISQALKLDAKSAPVHSNLGNALFKLKRHQEAVASYDRALAIKPDSVEALYNRGLALFELKRHQEALASYDRALAFNPDFAEALNNRGNALLELRRHGEAIASYDRALAFKPDNAEALYNRGNALLELERHEEAVASYDRALALKSDDAEALYNRGNALLELQRYEEAIKEFERLLSVKPDFDYARGELLSSKLQCCDWRDYDRNVELIVNDVAAGKRAISPFIFLSISTSPSVQLQCGQTYSKDRYAGFGHPIWKGERYCHDRIRVAYLSADFHDHATAYLMAELFEAHDKSGFEIIAISFGPDRKDKLRTRLMHAFDRFIDVRSQSDREISLLLKDLEIDIAVDLKGYTRGSRPRILAARSAPIQVSYLGYPGTMGVDYIDYPW